MPHFDLIVLSTTPLPDKGEVMSIPESDAKEICGLIGQIFFYGNFVAETKAERELEELLRKNGYIFETEEEMLEKLHGDRSHSENVNENDRLRERIEDCEVAVGQAVEFAQYVEDAAKGKMVERARHFLSMDFANSIRERLKQTAG